MSPTLRSRLAPYRRRRVLRAALGAGVAAGAVTGAVLGAWRAVAAVAPVRAPGLELGSSIVAVAALAVAMATLARAPGMLDVARALDRALGTAERIATALEWEWRGTTGEFAPLLAREAHAALDAHPPAACDPPLDRRRLRWVAALALLAPLAWLLPRAPIAAEAPAELVAPEVVEAMLAPLSQIARDAEKQQLPRAAREAREAAELVDAWRARPPEKRVALDALSRRLSRAQAARPPAGRGLARALTHALAQSALTKEAASRAREGDMAAAARALESALRDAAKRRRSLEEDRQVERLVKQLAQALRDAAAPGGDDALEEGDADTGLDRGAEDGRLEERRGRDVALWQLAEQLSKMDPRDLEQLAKGAGEALKAADTMKASELDRAALERLIKSLKEGKQAAAGEGAEGGKRVAITVPLPGASPGTGAGAGGASPGPGTGTGAGGSGSGTGAGQGGGETLTPFDRAALDGKPQPLAAPSAPAVSGDRLAIRGAPGAMAGAEVSRVRQAPQVLQGPRGALPAEAVRSAAPADETVEREAVPRRRQALVRKWFDGR